MKKILFILLLTRAGLSAQPEVAPADSSAGSNLDREAALRAALRQAINGPELAQTSNTAVPAPGAPPAPAPLPPAVVPFEPVVRTNPSAATLATNRPAPPIPIVTSTNPVATNAVVVPAVVPPPTTIAVPAAPAAVPTSPAAAPAAIPTPAPAIPAPAVPAPAVAAPGTGPSPGNLPAPQNPPSAEEIIPAGMINFQAVEIKDVFTIYAELVNRTILRPTTLPAPAITLKTVTPLTKREAIQALDAVLGMNGIAMLNVGDKFVKAVPIATAGQMANAPSKTPPDQLPELGPYVTHVVQLKYAKPTEMVAVLQPFASAIPNAILPIDSSQMLVLRDFSENVKRMLEMVAKIDIAYESDFIQEVIPIKYALASEIASALNSLSTGGGGTTVGSSSSSTSTRPAIGTGGSRMGTGSSYGSRPGTTGYPGQQPGMMNPQATGAATPGPGGSTSFTDRLNRIIQRASVTGDIQVLGQTKIIADERTNSLLIFASKEDMKMIKDIVAKLDIVLAQVLIEAVVLEVDITDNKDFGVSYLQQTPTTSGNFTGVGAIGKPFFTPGDFQPALQAATNAGAALKGGFNYLARFGDDLDVTVTAIKNDSRARILQRPRIQTSHAVQATLFVGESRPYPTASYYGGGSFGSYSSIQQLQIGVTLDVTPLINPDGLVVMDIHQTIENYAGFTEITGVGQVPNTTRKEAAAKVAVRDHDTIILGGLIETTKSRSGSGVPFLMDIPVLGYLFRTTNLSEKRTELVVLIRPTVLPTPEIAALTAKAEKDKMPGVSAVEDDIRREEQRRLKQSQQERKRP